MSTGATEPVKNIMAEKPAPAESPAQEAIATLRDMEQHLRAEAGFRGHPGSPVYDCDRIIRLAERCKKAAEKLVVDR
jgi:hypothetical protein